MADLVSVFKLVSDIVYHNIRMSDFILWFVFYLNVIETSLSDSKWVKRVCFWKFYISFHLMNICNVKFVSYNEKGGGGSSDPSLQKLLKGCMLL